MAVTNKLLRTIGMLFLASFAISLALFLAGALTPFELRLYDLFSRRLNPAKSPGDIVIVQVDQQSIDALSGEHITWPWPRQIYAPLIDYLSRADAVFVDILFTEPSSYGQEDDRMLAEAIRKAGNVYLPCFLSRRDREMCAADRAFLKTHALAPGCAKPSQSFCAAITPIPPLQEAVRGTGNVTMKPDRDGVYRQMPLVFGLGNEIFPHFILGYLLKQGTVTTDGHGFAVAGKPLPSAGDGFLLRYYRGAESFPVASAVELLRSYQDEQAGRTPAITRESFARKKVLIGLTAAGLYDLKPTPVSAVASGVMIHATLLDNLLHQNLLVSLAPLWSVVFMALLALAVTWFVLTHHGFAANLGFFCGAAITTVAVPALLFANSIYLQTVPPATALLVGMIVATGYSYATEGKERRFVRRAFAQYMDETLVSHLLANPDLIKPGGQRRRVTVFFADIAGFTTLAESLSAEETARLLHTVLNAFSEVVIASHGVIDKYIGDCIMAFWGAPLDTANADLDACRAALRCQETLRDINAGFRRDGLPEIAIRIGINTGDAIVGNLGSDRLFDYTVVGDTVNLASRLESANKQFGTRVIVSGATLAGTGEVFVSRELGMIAVKGKSEPVEIFELLALRDEAAKEVTTHAADYAGSMALFREGHWQEAAVGFARILAARPGDGPAAYYLKWCTTLLEHPPSADGWNILKMTEK